MVTTKVTRTVCKTTVETAKANYNFDAKGNKIATLEKNEFVFYGKLTPIEIKRELKKLTGTRNHEIINTYYEEDNYELPIEVFMKHAIKTSQE